MATPGDAGDLKESSVLDPGEKTEDSKPSDIPPENTENISTNESPALEEADAVEDTQDSELAGTESSPDESKETESTHCELNKSGDTTMEGGGDPAKELTSDTKEDHSAQIEDQDAVDSTFTEDKLKEILGASYDKDSQNSEGDDKGDQDKEQVEEHANVDESNENEVKENVGVESDLNKEDALLEQDTSELDINQDNSTDTKENPKVTNVAEGEENKLKELEKSLDSIANETEHEISPENKEEKKNAETSETGEAPENTEKDMKEMEKSVKSITHDTTEVQDEVARNSFETSVENVLSDKISPGDNIAKFEISDDYVVSEDASDMEKYMETKDKEDRKKLVSDKHQYKSDKPEKESSEGVKFGIGGTGDETMDATLSSSLEDSGRDFHHQMSDDSDHFRDRRNKPSAPLDALRSDASSTDTNHSKSNNHRKTSYGSITIPADTNGQKCCRCPECYPTGFCYELRHMYRIIWPMFFVQFFHLFFGPVALMYIGHIEDPDADAFLGVALALSVINVTGISVAMGLANACNTIFAQLRKAGRRGEVVIALQRGMLFALLAIMPCYAVYLNAESILLAMGIKPSICSITGEYLIIFTPGFIAFFFYIIIAKLLQNHRKVYFVMWIGLISNLVNVMLHFIMVFEMELGPRGSAISLTCTYVFMLLLMLIYLFWAGFAKNTWNLSWKNESFQDWGSFFSLVIPSVLSSCAEWWTVEIGLFLAGLISMRALGAQAVLIQLEIICYMFSLGLATATTVRITQSLHTANQDRAKTLARTALSVTFPLGIILVLILLALHTPVPYVFASNNEMVDYAASVIPIMCLYIFCDCHLVVSAGIFRACGRDFFEAAIVVPGFIVSLILGTVLMFEERMDLKGWWLGIGAVCVVEAIICVMINLFTNWENQVKQAKKRYDILMMSTSKSSSSGGKYAEKTALLAAKEKDFTASYDDYYSKDFDFQASYEHPTRTYSEARDYNNPPNPSDSGRPKLRRAGLSTTQLILRRGSVILLFVGMLVAGIVLRLYS